ncbi:MAG: alpha/beta fold hydrolase [Dehalococcoidales bacterium]|nr:alpha/beta fold hydrolase [Dehalococcoidales bacterium]
MDIDKIINEIEEGRGYGSEQYVTVGGMNIRCSVSGDGPPLLLLHGFGEFLETWDFNFHFLSEHCRVYAMDLPGHGLSDKPYLDYKVSFFTDFVIGFMDNFGINHANIIGHSFGGAIAASVAASFPEKVDKLVLESCFGLSNDISLLHNLCSMPVMGSVDSTEPAVRSALEHRVRMEFYNPDFVAREIAGMSYRFMQMKEASRVMLNIMHNWVGVNGLKPEVVMIDKLHLIKSPTLFIHCEQDRIHPVNLSQKAYRLIPKSSLKVFNECGHCPHIEKAAQFNEEVLAFLERG